jgi:hypothetical protein
MLWCLPKRLATRAQNVDDVKEKQVIGLSRGVAARLFEKEEIERRGDGGTKRTEHVGAHDAQYLRTRDQGEIISRSKAFGFGEDRFFGFGRKKDRGQRAQDDGCKDEAAHQRHALERNTLPQHRQQGRNEKNADRTHDSNRLDPTIDAAALMIFGDESCTPRGLRERQHRIAHVEEEQPADEVTRTDSLVREIDHPDREQEKRRGCRQPRPVFSNSGPRPIHRHAEQRIDRNIEEPHHHEGASDRGQRDADVAGIVICQIDAERRHQSADGQRAGRKSRQASRRDWNHGGGIRDFVGHQSLPNAPLVGVGTSQRPFVSERNTKLCIGIAFGRVGNAFGPR